MSEVFYFGLSNDLKDFPNDNIDNKLLDFLGLSFSELSCKSRLGFRDFSDLRGFSSDDKLGDIDFLLYSYDKFVDISLKSRDYLATAFPLLEGSNSLSLGRGGFVFVFLRSRSDIIDKFSYLFGKVYLVGAGAGNKELLSIRGMKRLMSCDIVISDHLLDKEILNSYVSKDAILLPLTKYGARTQKNLVSQSEINEAILRYSLLLREVVRLKGGDPFVFARGGEECEYLLPFKISYEVVPGISSMLSALAYSGIPLTHRDYNDGFLAITGYRKDCETNEDFCNQNIAAKVNFALDNHLMVVLFMSLGNWKSFAPLIKDQSAPVAFIESGAYNKQRTFVTDVSSSFSLIERSSFGSPTLISIGENVRERVRLKWFESLPLYGKRVLAFSSSKLSGEIYNTFSYLAADIKVSELYELIPSDIDDVSSYLGLLCNYDYIVVTSRNSFNFLIHFLKVLSIDIRSLPKIVVTGSKTANDFKDIGILVDILPSKFSSEGIIEALRASDIKGKRFLFPKSSLSDGNISSFLRESGAFIDDFVLYENRERDLSERELSELITFNPDYIIFTSSSSVDLFAKKVYREGMDFIAVSMGNKTTTSLRNYGFGTILEPSSFTIEGVKEVILKDALCVASHP